MDSFASMGVWFEYTHQKNTEATKKRIALISVRNLVTTLLLKTFNFTTRRTNCFFLIVDSMITLKAISHISA
jgi:hypothetical protein